MTRAQEVKELRRRIRGIAMNYPVGLGDLADELAKAWLEKKLPTRILFGEMEPVPAVWQHYDVDMAGVVTRREENQAEAVGQPSAAPQTQVPGIQQEKRKRGRPRKVQG